MATNQELTQLQCDLVAIPSVNPEHHRECSEAPYGEARMADYVENYFRPFGVRIERQQALPGRENVLVHVAGTDPSAKPILLEAHMDTVGPEGMISPFHPRVEDGRVYGRGACDTKGSLAAMMFVVRELLEKDVRLPGPCVLAATVDEEFGMSGAHRVVQSGMAYAGAIVGEPTALRIVPAHDGQMYLKITAHGRAAHTSMPQHGVNAIYLMDEVIEVLKRRAASEYPKRVHALCGSPKLTISMIKGGISEHIVPDSCEITIDFRVIPGETCQRTLEEIRDWLSADLDANTFQRIRIAEPHKAEPPMETQVDHPLVQGMRQAATAVLGDAQVQGVPYNTDASHYGAAGTPCVVFGPGGIGQAHSSVEYAEIGQLAAAVEILRRFLLEGAT